MIATLSSLGSSIKGSPLRRLTRIRYFSSKDCLGSQGLAVHKIAAQLSITQNPNQTQDGSSQPRFGLSICRPFSPRIGVGPHGVAYPSPDDEAIRNPLPVLTWDLPFGTWNLFRV